MTSVWTCRPGSSSGSWGERLRQDDHDPAAAGSAGTDRRAGRGAGLRYAHPGGRDPRTLRGAAGASRLYERMSAEANLDYYGRINRMPAAERAARIEASADPSGPLGAAQGDSDRLGRGMKQKLAMPVPCCTAPRCLSGRADGRAGCRRRVGPARRPGRAGRPRGRHDLPDDSQPGRSEKLCARVAVIREGRLLAVGSPDELRGRAGNARLMIVGRGFSAEVCDGLRQLDQVHAVECVQGHLAVTLAMGPKPRRWWACSCRPAPRWKKSGAIRRAWRTCSESGGGRVR